MFLSIAQGRVGYLLYRVCNFGGLIEVSVFWGLRLTAQPVVKLSSCAAFISVSISCS